jgi:hypothetical protein
LAACSYEKKNDEDIEPVDEAETKEAEKLFRGMNVRCRRATAFLESQEEVSSKRGAKVLGVGNIVVKARDQLEL